MSSADVQTHQKSVQQARLWYGLTCVVLLISILTSPLHTVWFSASLYFIAVMCLMAADLQAFLVTLLIIVRFAVVVVSLVMIESGEYVAEQFRYGFNNGSTALQVPYLILFLLVFHYFTHRFAYRFSGKIDLEGAPLRRFYWILLLGYAAVILAFVATLIVYGTASDVGGDRYVYWSHLPDRVGDVVMGLRFWGLSALAVFLGFYTRYVKRPAVTLLAAYVLTFVLLYLMGEKFAALYNNIFLFLTGFALAAIIANKPVKLRPSVLFFSLIAVLGLYFALDAGYEVLSGGRADTAESITDRITLESHVWFGIVDLGRGVPFVDFHDMWKFNSLDTPSGLDFLSYLVSSPDYVHKRLSDGITFTQGGAPAALAVFGYVGGLLFFGVEAFLYPLVGLLLLSFLKARMIVPAFVSVLGYNLVMQTAIMGYWAAYHSRVAMIWGAVMIAGQLLRATRRPTAGVLESKASKWKGDAFVRR